MEGLSYKVKLTIREAYGYRELLVSAKRQSVAGELAEISIYHELRRFPEPELTHRSFC